MTYRKKDALTQPTYGKVFFPLHIYFHDHTPYADTIFVLKPPNIEKPILVRVWLVLIQRLQFYHIWLFVMEYHTVSSVSSHTGIFVVRFPNQFETENNVLNWLVDMDHDCFSKKGPEMNEEEIKEQKTKLNRGLLFVSYQSSIEDGFIRVQQVCVIFNDITFFTIICPFRLLWLIEF